jgi:hypothetical protein
VGRILAQELVGRVRGGLFLALAVVDIDQVEAGLAGLIGERKARGQCLVLLDGILEVILFIALCALAYSDWAVAFLRFLACRLWQPPSNASVASNTAPRIRARFEGAEFELKFGP